MKKLLAAALLLTAGLTMSAHASLISGPITFDGSKTVDLQGLEWMPLAYTQGLSRYDVESGFNDSTKAWGAGSWRYATRNETESLLGSLWGGRYDGWSYDNFVGASKFIELFGATWSTDKTNKSSTFLFGAVGDCTQSLVRSCYGTVQTYHGSYPDQYTYDKLNGWNLALSAREGQQVIGRFDEEFGLNAGRHDNNNVVDTMATHAWMGSLLVRSMETPVAPVSSPAALSLFALGLCGLLLRRRKIAA
jgi:hypothetical protein